MVKDFGTGRAIFTADGKKIATETEIKSFVSQENVGHDSLYGSLGYWENRKLCGFSSSKTITLCLLVIFFSFPIAG